METLSGSNVLIVGEAPGIPELRERLITKGANVQVVSVDVRRRRIGLAPEGSRVEGTRGDYAAYVKQQQREEESGFKPFAAALKKLKK